MAFLHSPSSGIDPCVEQPVASKARQLLDATGYAGLRGVTCTWHEGVLILRGRVATYYLKQVAQVAVCHLLEVELVDNRVEVIAANGASDEASTRWPAGSRTDRIAKTL